MTKKMKLRKGRILIVVVFIIAIAFAFRVNTNSYKLGKIGYNKEEISKIEDSLPKNVVNSITKQEYHNDLGKIIANKAFKLNNLDNYLKLSKELGKYDVKVVDIVNEKYFKEKLGTRYINYYKKNNSLTSRQIVENVNCNLDYEYYKADNKVDFSKGHLLLVNKFYKLENDYVPSTLVKIDKKYGYERMIDKTVYNAFIDMYNDIEKEGMALFVTSPYRSYNYQQKLYNNYVTTNGQKMADSFSAKPGYSEHQTGFAVDLASKNSMYTKFQNTKEYQWMLNNCYKYGFILRYPKDKEKQTGYMFEAWHYRYVGKKVAKYIHDNKITYDEYYEYFLN